MKIGDDPELRRNLGGGAGGDSAAETKCPKCGKRKNPGYDVCYECSQAQRGGGGSAPGTGAAPRGPSPPEKLPDQFAFDSFYDEKGKLRQDLFFDVPEQVADLLVGSGLEKAQVRQLYQGLLECTVPIRDGRGDFRLAKERFSASYVEPVVRQHGRG